MLNKLKAAIKGSKPDELEIKIPGIYEKYKGFTMVPVEMYHDSLRLAKLAIDLEGDIVECGVWRGGMIAGIADVIGKGRNYFLFDSFEGLPPVKDIDGDAAKKWQSDPTNDFYFDNCKAEIDYAIKAMEMSGVEYKCIKGWFSDTMKDTSAIGDIALLRLDADWYESTMDCLSALFPKVVEGGLVIIDDYYAWTGCSRAVHDYLSSIQSASRLHMSTNNVAYIIKHESKT